MSYYNEASQVRSLVNLYRSNPKLFSDDQLDMLQERANEFDVEFKPLQDSTSLTSLAQNFAGGFVRGLVPLVPPDEQPRTTYEAIARSLGHLAGFAPSILSLPLRGVTSSIKGIGALVGATSKAAQAAKRVERVAQPIIGTLDKISLPMIGSRLAKAGLGKGISKLELETLDYMKAGGVARSIAEESVGLGTATMISNIWAGPDEYINTFLGGALVGGAFGGIGNFVRLGNVFKTGNPAQVKKAENALKAGLGASITGIPSTLANEPIEKQIYEYLLGGFFGYSSRPAAEAAGGKFIQGIDTKRQELIFTPESMTGYNDLNTNAQNYVKKQSLEQAKDWLGRVYEGDPNAEAIRRAKVDKRNPTPEDINTEYRKLAYKEYMRRKTAWSFIESNENIPTDDRMDYMDDSHPPTVSIRLASESIYNSLGEKAKLTTPDDISRDIQRKIDQNSQEAEGYAKEAPDVESFIDAVRGSPYGEFADNPKNERALRKLFHQSSKRGYEVYVFDADSNILTKENKIDDNLKYVGIKYFDSPIVDVFNEGREFKFLNTIRINGESLNIFDYNTFKGQFNTTVENVDKLPRIVTELHKENEYIYAGIKDKSVLLVAPYNDVINGKRLTIGTLAEHIDPEMRTEFSNYYRISKETFNNRFPELVKNNPEIHERQFVSNIFHELINQGYKKTNNIPDLTKIPEVINKKYFNDAIDFNKRMQGYAEFSGIPMHEASFAESVPGAELRFMVLRDKDFNSDADPKNSETDGGLFFRTNVFKDIIKAMGFNPTFGNVKPVVAGRLNDRNGIAFIKSSGKTTELTGDKKSAIEKIIKDHDLHFVTFESSNKIPGDMKSTKFDYNPEANEYTSRGDIDIIHTNLKSLRINPSTYEDAVKAVKGTNIPRQMFITLNSLQSPKALKTFINHYYKYMDGTEKTKPMVESYKQSKNFDDIEKFLGESIKNIDQMPLDFIFEKLAEPGKEGDIMRRAMQKIAKEDEILMESFEFDSDKRFDAYHNTVNNLFNLAQGKFIPSVFFEKIRQPYMNQMRKYLMKRITTPFWPYGGKAWMNPVTKDVYYNADIIDPRIKTKAAPIGLESPLKEELQTYANKVVSGDSKVKNIYLIGSTAKKGKGKDIDILYDLGKRDVPKWVENFSDMAEWFFPEISPDNISFKYDNIFKITDQNNKPHYFHIDPKDPMDLGRVMHNQKVIDDIESGVKINLLAAPTKEAPQIKTKGIAVDEVLLDNAHKKMTTKIEAPKEQIDFLNTIFNKKVINDNGETDLGTLWELYKATIEPKTAELSNRIKSVGKAKLLKNLNDALDLLIIRVPADAISGTRAVKFRGFTNQIGAGITTNRKADKYLGGADKDADSVFIIQNGDRTHRREVLKAEGERDGLDEAALMIRNGAVESNLPAYSKFSPIHRLQAYATGRQGAAIRGQAIAMRDALFEIHAQAKNNGGTIKYGGLEFTIKRGGMQKFIKDVYAAINISNDSTKYLKIDNINKIKARLYNDLFTIKKDGYPIDGSKVPKSKKAGLPPEFKNILDFHSAFKTNPFSPLYKKYEHLLTLAQDKQLSNTEFGQAAGRQFKYAIEKGLFKRLDDIGDAKTFGQNIKLTAEKYSNDKQEQDFIREFLGVSKSPLKTLSNLNDVYPEPKNLFDDININLSKMSLSELLNENALDVYRSFSEGKKQNIPDIKRELTRIYNNARELSIGLYGSTAKHESIEKIYNVREYDKAINENKKGIMKFAKQNNIPFMPLLKYFDTALMVPVRVKVSSIGKPIDSRKNLFRVQNAVFGSNAIMNSSKRSFFDKMQELYDRSTAFPEAVGKQEVLKEPLIKTTTDYKEQVKNVDKAISIADTTVKTATGKSILPEDIDIVAFTDKDVKEIQKLREHIKENPQIDSFNDWVVDFTYRQGAPKDASLVDMNDIRAMNSYFEWTKTGKPKEFSWWNWLKDPRTISDKELFKSVKVYEQYITGVMTAKGPQRIKIKRYLTPLSAMRDFFRKIHTQQNVYMDRLLEDNTNIFDYRRFMSKEDQFTLTELVSNKRNPEEAPLTDKKYNEFLARNIEGKTGQEWLNVYDQRVTDFMDKVGKEWLYTYGKDGRFDFVKEIDAAKNPKYGRINKYMEYESKTGRFNFERFFKQVLNPVQLNKRPPQVGVESLLRYQWELGLEKALAREGKGKVTKDRREAYRKKNDFIKQMGFGYIEPDRYYPRTNYGFSEKAKRQFDKSVIRIAEKRREAALADGRSEGDAQRAYDNAIAELGMFRDVSLNQSAKLETQFLDKQYEDVGYDSKPKNLLQRGEEFLDGYDKRPVVFDKYKEQIIRSYFSNIAAIYGNKEIETFKKSKVLDKGLTSKQSKILKDNGYEGNTDLWSDYLYMYLKNSLGHPTLLTNRIQKSINKGDPLKLKNNPFYITTDYAITKALEKMHEAGKFKKLPFMRNAPKDKLARRDYWVRRIHDLGKMEARYNLLTLLANTGTMMTNLYGGATMTAGSASFKNWYSSQRDSEVTKKLLQNAKGEYELFFKNGKPVTTRKELIQWMNEEGVIDNYIANELEYNEALSSGIKKLGKDGKNFIRELKRNVKSNAPDETLMQLAERYGIKDTMLKTGGFFMAFSERKNRIDAFISHALQAKDRLGDSGIHATLKDPFIFDMAMKGIETTQFLYHSAFRPAFMTTALGKVLTRFKLFQFQSVRTRKEFYKQAKAYGFKEGTPAYDRFKDLFLMDLFTYALAGAYMYSVFDTALPPPWDWIQDTGDLMFGDKKERDRAFFGTLPRAIAPMQVALPPIARFPQTFVELIQGDWEKFSDYTIHTMYPFGRMIYSGKKWTERPEKFFESFFRLPVQKVLYRIDREKVREARKKMLEEGLENATQD